MKKILELDPSNDQSKKTIRRLQPLAEEKREKMKEEMIGKYSKEKKYSKEVFFSSFLELYYKLRRFLSHLRSPLCHSCPSKNEVALKSPFDQNSIMINHKLNGDFEIHLIFGVTQDGLLALFQFFMSLLLPMNIWCFLFTLTDLYRKSRLQFYSQYIYTRILFSLFILSCSFRFWMLLRVVLSEFLRL
jgi:hypothetical protein